MKLKLEKDYSPISFDIMTPDEIAKNRKLEEDKLRRAREREAKAQKAKAKKAELLECKRKRNKRVSLFLSLTVLSLGIVVVIVLVLKNKSGETVDNAIPFLANGEAFYMIPVPVPEQYKNISTGADWDVVTKDFNISETEVTRGLWYAVMGDEWAKGSANKPVTHVALNDIYRFIRKLSSITGTEFRLPSFSEYLSSASYFNDVNSENLNKYAWFSSNASYDIHPVKRKLPNSLGVYDILGNVQEVTADLLDYWSPDSDGQRVFFGGGVSDNKEIILDNMLGKRIFSGRVSDECDIFDYEIGFRLVQGGGVSFYPRGYRPEWDNPFTPDEYRDLRECVKSYYQFNGNAPLAKSMRFYESSLELGYDVTQCSRVGQEPQIIQSSIVKNALAIVWGEGDDDYMLLVFSKCSSGKWCLDNVIEKFNGDSEPLFKY